MTTTLAELCGLADDEPPRTRPYRPLIIHPPAPGEFVLACACGKAIGGTDMRVVDRGRRANGDPMPGRVVCVDCARNRAW